MSNRTSEESPYRDNILVGFYMKKIKHTQTKCNHFTGARSLASNLSINSTFERVFGALLSMVFGSCIDGPVSLAAIASSRSAAKYRLEISHSTLTCVNFVS